ncbi:MAG: PotD/PotF family extracellular solute-binding protein [Acidimicrobiales bacterium]
MNNGTTNEPSGARPAGDNRRRAGAVAAPGRTMSRRELIRRAGLWTAGLAIPPAVLAACGTADDANSADTGSGTDSSGSAGEATDTPPAAAGSDAGSTIKVATYGGFFEENFRELYPRFTEETGIAVESIPEPDDSEWVVQLQQAAQSGTTLADVSILNNISLQRGIKGDIIHSYNIANVPNSQYLADGFVVTGTDDDVVGIGALSWYYTLVSNTEKVPESPTSWATLWDPIWNNQLALMTGPYPSFLLDITAATWYPGEGMLDTQAGIEEVMRKLAELKPNVKLWWRDESTAQPDYNSGEVSIGQFFHDIASYAADEGEPLRSVFPTEGAVLDSGLWAISSTTAAPEASVAFIDWMCRPAIQEELALTLGTSPTVAKEHMDLTDEDYEAISGPGPEAAIQPNFGIYEEWESWVNEKWAELIYAG